MNYLIFGIFIIVIIIASGALTFSESIVNEPHNTLGRIYNLAVIDIVSTLIVGIIAGWYFDVSYFIAIPSLFLAGIVAHFIYNINTPVANYITSIQLN